MRPEGDRLRRRCDQQVLRRLRTYLNGKGLVLMASVNSGTYGWLASSLDAVGGEAAGADPLDKAYVRRTMGYGKPWSNLHVPVSGPAPRRVDGPPYLRQALLFGYFPGFNGTYWDNSSAYERDRSLFRKYIP